MPRPGRLPSILGLVHMGDDTNEATLHIYSDWLLPVPILGFAVWAGIQERGL